MAIISLDLLGSCLHNLWLWMKVSKNWSRINSALPTTQKRHTVWKNVYYKSRYHPTCAKYFAHDCKSRKRTNKQLIPLRSQVPLLSYQKRGSFYYIQRIWRGGVLGRFIKIYHVGNYNIPSITKGSRGGGPQVSFFILCTSRPLGWPGPFVGQDIRHMPSYNVPLHPFLHFLRTMWLRGFFRELWRHQHHCLWANGLSYTQNCAQSWKTVHLSWIILNCKDLRTRRAGF